MTKEEAQTRKPHVNDENCQMFVDNWIDDRIDKIYDDFERELKELRANARDNVCNCDYPKETFESIFGYNYITDEKIDLL